MCLDCDDHEQRAMGADMGPWDGGKAMSMCAQSDSPGSCYGAVCAGRKVGPADQQSSWALPHHMGPGMPPNAAAVRNALARLPQTDGLTNASAARAHLEAHLAAINEGRSREENDMTERRFTLVPVELRATSERRSIGGYAAVFEKPSQNLGGFIEVVNRSFFNKARGDGWPDVMCRWNHEDAYLLGTTYGRTLRLSIDEMGLVYEVDPPAARDDLVELVQRGDITKSSFAFRVPPGGDEWGLSEQGYPQRSLITGQLVDVAPVNAPAYLDTSVGLRSLAAQVNADFEEVRALAEQNELRKFFVRTDGKGKAVKPAPKRTFGPAAAAALMARRSDPWE